MPHIIVEYSKTVGTEIDMDQLLSALHKSLAGQGVEQERIKTRAMGISQSVVGNNPPGVGLMVPAGRFQKFSVAARCSSFATRRPPGNACASVPTSRTVPHADGWPVRLVGASPGVPK